jgi:hypothetical protein
MDRHEKLVKTTLKQHGAVMVRAKKHEVWRFPDGRQIVTASTPSDGGHGWKNKWSELRRMLRLDNEGRPVAA